MIFSFSKTDKLPRELSQQIKDTPWQAPWWPIDGSLAKAREDELRAELGPDHALYDIRDRVIAVADRQDCDDTLFCLGDGRLAIVHLTYNLRPEPYPKFPDAQIFNTYREFLECAFLPEVNQWRE